MAETPEQTQARETVEQIAANIAKLADSVALLLRGPLKQRALFVLLSHSSGLSDNTVAKVLEALANLKKDWLRQ